MQVAQAERNFLNPVTRFAQSAKRGLLLSHLVGISFFCSFLIGPAFLSTFLYTKPLEWPIRFIAVWLVVDRLGKAKRNTITAWDWANLLFVACYGIALIYADLFMSRDMGFINYLKWVNTTFDGYLYFLVIREGLSRRGFRTEIVLRWMVATFLVVCLLALAQARDFAGLRGVINGVYHQAQIELHMEGPSQPWQARAPASHANSLAIMLLAGLPLFFALADLKKFRWFDGIVCALMVVTLFMTYSRTGVVALGAEALAVIAIFLARKQYLKATIMGGAIIVAIIAFVAIVIAFDIGRFKILTESANPATTSTAEQTVGWKERQQSLAKSLGLAEKYPVLGVSAASAALNDEDYVFKNAYTYQGLLLNVYAYSFVSFGLFGVGFLLAAFALLLGEARFLRRKRAFAAACFMLGFGMLAAGVTENVLFFDGVTITLNILLACAITKVVPTEQAALPESQPDALSRAS